mgnify:CR=1 FL=1
MTQIVKINKTPNKPLTARNVTIWLVNYYSIARGNELSLYWGLPYWVDNYEAIRMWVESLIKQPRPEGRTLGDVRMMFEERLPI